MDEPHLVPLLGAWLLCWAAIGFTRARRRTPATGLVFAYLVNLWASHWLGASIYALPWYNVQDWRLVQAGFEQSLYAVLAFGVGAVVVAPVLLSLRPPGRASEPLAPDPKLARVYLVAGAIAYGALATVLGRVPTVTSLLSAAQQLLVIGVCLACWHGWRTGRVGTVVGWLLVTAILPIWTIVFTGFLAYGAAAALVVYVFAARFLRPRVLVITGCLLLSYVGLSFYVSYMRDRGEIREVVWGGRPLDERVEQVWGTIVEMEWFNPSDQVHLWQIDRRLNQNGFLGLAAERLARGDNEYAYGETVLDSLLALIPRAVWADKPVLAGSGDLVTRFTGVRFAEGTSVGIGQVMELYVNFGTTGILVGFLIIGTAVAIIDRRAREALDREDWKAFALWYMPGVAILQVGGAFVEMTGTAAASLVATLAVNRIVYRGLFRERWSAAPRSARAWEA